MLDADGRVRSSAAPARVSNLKQQLIDQFQREGELLLALQSLRQADRFQQQRQHLRLQQHRRSAQGLMAAGGGVGAGAQQGDLLHCAQGSSGCQSG